MSDVVKKETVPAVVGDSKKAETMIRQSQLPPQVTNNIFSNMQLFEDTWRMAKCLSTSELVPDTFRNKPENCLIAIDIARRMDLPPLSVMKAMFFVHGKWGWESKFKIGCFNQSGRFSPLRYEDIGEPNTDGYGKRAYATDNRGEICRGPAVTIAMAKKEGWLTKNGSKWQTMPELMLMYRSASMMIDVYDPSISMGFNTVDEIYDVSGGQSSGIRSALAPAAEDKFAQDAGVVSSPIIAEVAKGSEKASEPASGDSLFAPEK